MKPEEEEKAALFWSFNKFVHGSYDSEEGFRNLNDEIEKGEKGSPVGNRLFYLALPPSVFEPVTLQIKVSFYLTCGTQDL